MLFLSYGVGVTFSIIITGNDSKTLTLCTYIETEDVLTAIDEFLHALPGA